MTQIPLSKLLYDDTLDLQKLKKAEIGTLDDLARAILLDRGSATSVTEMRARLAKIKQMILNWAPRDQKRLVDRWTAGSDPKALILTDLERQKYKLVGIEDLLKEQGDEDLLLELESDEDPRTALELLHSISDSASVLRRRQIKSRYVRYTETKRREAERKAAMELTMKQKADQAINSILYGVDAKLRRGENSSVNNLGVQLSPVEGRVELTPQNQIDKTMATVEAADHLLRLAETVPRLTKNQQLAVDFLKEVRATNETTFKAIRKRLAPHLQQSCRLTTTGQMVHGSSCPDSELKGSDLIQLFRLSMVEIQPATRHAMRVLLQKGLTNPDVDYLWVLNQSSVGRGLDGKTQWRQKGTGNATKQPKKGTVHLGKPEPSSSSQ